MKKHLFNNKSILITGGTGSFGKAFCRIVLDEYQPERLIVFSRDELKQYEMSQQYADHADRIRYFIGDVRDKDRLMRAFDGVDYVVHAAALKQVPAMEYNPSEAIKTNIYSAMNIIDAAIDKGVKRIVALSTDKACNPINLYGATKLCSDKLFISGNSYAGLHDTRFAVVRYGNVVGSRGSVVPFFKSKSKEGVLPITDERMTRFWITLQLGVRFVIKSFERMHGGELFVPKIPSMNIMDLAKAIAPNCRTEIVGIRPGEKLHEVMISEDDARQTLELDDCYVIKPAFNWWGKENHASGKRVADGFSYSSDNNPHWLSIPELQRMIEE
ncbi:UDP-N-acetylglucosamine 4,6-dehydratase (inverting) [Candidatus Saganbacteria bacterium]|nr:UDP-N-acetylglucosamine 4,6-dehydratase (inverting) [Candidatus Saganbacteria bacterium]